MTKSDNATDSFGIYFRNLLKIVVSSSLPLALLAGAAMLLIGETSMNLDITLDFSALDGLWVLFGLPVIAVLIFAVLAPISFYVFRLLSR